MSFSRKMWSFFVQFFVRHHGFYYKTSVQQKQNTHHVLFFKYTMQEPKPSMCSFVRRHRPAQTIELKWTRSWRLGWFILRQPLWLKSAHLILQNESRRLALGTRRTAKNRAHGWVKWSGNNKSVHFVHQPQKRGTMVQENKRHNPSF